MKVNEPLRNELEEDHSILQKIKVSKKDGQMASEKEGPKIPEKGELGGMAGMIRDEVVKRVENFRSVDKKLDHVLLNAHSYGEVEVSYLNVKSEKYAAKVKKIAEALDALGERKVIKREQTRAKKYDTLIDSSGLR